MSVFANVGVFGTIIAGAVFSAVLVNKPIEASEQDQVAASAPAPKAVIQSTADLIAKFNQSMPLITSQFPIQQAKATNIDGLYELVLQNGQVIYASDDGRHVLLGNSFALYEIKENEFVDLTENTDNKYD